jgi:hypothetical protein
LVKICCKFYLNKKDNDGEMLSFLLNKNLTTKEHILECIKKVHDWQTASYAKDSTATNSSTSMKESATSTIATTTNLKLELAPEHTIVTTIEELEAYLVKCNLSA